MQVQAVRRRLTYVPPEQWAGRGLGAVPDETPQLRARIAELEALVADLRHAALLAKRADLRRRAAAGYDLTADFRAAVAEVAVARGVSVAAIMARHAGGRMDAEDLVVLPARDAAISACLEMGGRLDAVAAFFGLAPSRISQIRAKIKKGAADV